MGDEHAAGVLASLLASLAPAPSPSALSPAAAGALPSAPLGPPADPPPPSEETESIVDFIDLEPTSASTTTTTQTTVEKVEEMRALIDDLSAILTPSEISALFSGTASTSVLEIVVDVVRVRHPSRQDRVGTNDQILSLFEKISKLVNVDNIF